MKYLLHPCERSPQPHTTPQPLIPQLRDARPERINILICAICIERSLSLALVASRLVSFCLVVSTYVSEEDVVCDWTKELDGGEHIGGVEEDGEGGVDEEIA